MKLFVFNSYEAGLRCTPYLFYCVLFSRVRKHGSWHGHSEAKFWFHGSLHFQDWAAWKLGVQIIVMTGELRPGTLATKVYGPMKSEGNRGKPVWIWHHPIFDEQKNRAEHFSLLSQVGNVQVEEITRRYGSCFCNL